MIALWEKPHNLVVKSEDNPFGGGYEFKAQTATNGCGCRGLVEALTAQSIGLEVHGACNLPGVGRRDMQASLQIGSAAIAFCPFCGKSAKLLMPRTEWKSKAGEKTRL